MLLTSGLLGLLYVIFAVVLFSVLNVGLAPMLVIVVGLAFFQYYTSDKIALAASGAKIVTAEQAPDLHAMVERLCAMADLPKPRIAVVQTDVPNAFATGRNPKHAAVAVTSGLWQRLEKEELEAVLAHELSHIANRDVLVMTVASFFAMVAAMVTRFGLYAGMFGGFGGGNRNNNNGPDPVFIVLIASMVVYAISWVLIRTISRYREYAADRGSALITGAPENLMSALQKISSGITQIPQQDLREVQGMNAFFIIPTNWKASMAEWIDGSPAAREAPRRPRGDRPRHGQARQLASAAHSLAVGGTTAGKSAVFPAFVHRPVSAGGRAGGGRLYSAASEPPVTILAGPKGSPLRGVK